MAALAAATGIAGAPAAAAGSTGPGEPGGPGGPGGRGARSDAAVTSVVRVPNLEYGATYLRSGTVTWSDRSARLDGTLRGLSTCRTANLYAYRNDGNILDIATWGPVCNAVQTIQLDVLGNVPGGPAYVYVELAGGQGQSFRTAQCTRTRCLIVP